MGTSYNHEPSIYGNAKYLFMLLQKLGVMKIIRLLMIIKFCDARKLDADK